MGSGEWRLVPSGWRLVPSTPTRVFAFVYCLKTLAYVSRVSSSVPCTLPGL
jgi:hypothetical protein